MVKRGAALALLLAGCLTPPPGASGAGISFPCSATVTCPAGQVCGSEGVCQAAPAGSSSGGASSGAGTSSGSSSSGSTGTSTTTTAASSSGSSGTTTGSSSGTTSGSSGSSGTTGGSSSGGSSGAPLNFAGDWDMDWGTMTLAQTGTTVNGSFQQWGSNGAGTVTGTAAGDAFRGGFYWPYQSATQTGVFFALGDGGTSLSGSWGNGQFPWCGVRPGSPLFPGCGWSDTFMVKFNDAQAAPIVLTQTADEVVGTYNYGDGGLAGLVSSYRLSGVTTAGGAATGKFSFWWTTAGNDADQGWTELGFLGNWQPADGAVNPDWCGVRQSSPGSFPTACLGGGGLYDGTWITNLGMIQLDQAIGQTEHVGLNWNFWGASAGSVYNIPTGNPNPSDNSVIGPQGLSWDSAETPPSPAAGAVNLLPQFSDGGLVMYGQTGTGQLWCGAQYFPDPYNHQDPLGTLPPGCGLTNEWTVWQAGPDGSAAPATLALTQVRGSVVGDGGIVVDGNVLANPLATSTDDIPLIYVTGSWSATASGEGGSFTWYPDAGDQAFEGDYSVADAGLAAWCGSLDPAAEPNPCLQ